ncbi:MAG: MBL fold metallo-hydrolase [Candidatus Helarchaeota archaeon]
MQPENRYKEIKRKSRFFRICDNILMIFQEKTSVNYNSCNSYIIKDGNRITIIDPGISRLKLKHALKIMGLEIQNIKNIILTHAHSDHYVLVGYLCKKVQPDIYIHRYDREFLENSKKYIDFLFDISFFKNRPKFRDFYRILEYFSREIDENKRDDLDLNSAIKGVFDTWKIYSIKPDFEYKNHDSLPGELKAIHLPGHTPGHSGLLCKNMSIIFCADIDFNKRGPTVSSKFSSIHSYKKSIKKLIKIIQGYRIKYLYPGHWNPIFSEFVTNLNNFSEKFVEKEDKISKLLNEKGKMTIDEISQETFKGFSLNFKDFLDDTNRDSLLIAEASDLMTNRNYLIEMKRLNKINNIFISGKEYWKLK